MTQYQGGTTRLNIETVLMLFFNRHAQKINNNIQI